MPPRITVEPWGGNWRAHVRVSGDFLGGAGIMGASTDDGPWVEGAGSSPEAALRALMQALGTAWLTSRPEGGDGK